jgi:hypothetical protein
VVERLGATEKRSFSPFVFFDQKVSGLASTYLVLFPWVLIVSCGIGTMGLKSRTRGLPAARILVFPGFAFGRHVSMIPFLSCLYFLIPLLLSTTAAARPTAMRWTSGGCKVPRTADLKVAVRSAWRVSFFSLFSSGVGLEGLPFGFTDFKVDGWWFGGH